MSAGAVFKILTNDGKADQMLMATQLLKDRICDIIEAREAAGKDDTLPTLRDIEFTHVLHFQSKFKPFVALGYEYQNVKQQSGTQTFGGTVQFNIPQFGDFLTDTVVNTVFSSCSCAAAALPSAASVLGNTGVPDGLVGGAGASFTNQVLTLPDGSTVNSLETSTFGVTGGSAVPCVNVRRLRGSRFVDEAGRSVASTALVQDNVYYCDYPGERLFIDTKFEVNGNPLDEYDHMTYTYYRKYRLCADKQVSYNRNMGQENPVNAVTNNVGYGVRQRDVLLNGPQTPNQVQPQLTMWIKLLFWFNLDHSQALVSAAIPSGQRYITFQLANVSDLVFRAPSVWYESVLTTDVFAAAPATNGVAVTAGSFTLVGGLHEVGQGGQNSSWCLASWNQLLRYPVLTNGTLSSPTLTSMNLYVNNIFTIPEIHDIYIERIGFSLIRVHRRHQAGVNVSSYQLLMSNFKYPIEFFYCGLRPDVNINGPNRDVDWHSFMSNTRSQVLGSGSVTSLLGSRTVYSINHTTGNGAVVATSGNTSWANSAALGVPSTAPGAQTGTVVTTPLVTLPVDGTDDGYAEGWKLSVASSSTRTVVNSVRTIDTVGVQAHGVDLYANFDSSFFVSYMPEVYGGGPASQVLVSPSDQGLLFINFCLHPYENQPSGHVNTSRAREFYVNFSSSVINSTNTGTFLAEAQALNFLLVSDGSAVLRYTT